MPRNN